MRLLTFTIFVLLALLVLILIFPAVFLQATAPVVPDQLQQGAGILLAGFSMDVGRPLTAVAVYDFVINRHTDQSDLYRLKSDALQAAGDSAAAEQALDQAISRDPQNPLLLTRKARFLINEGKTGEADLVLSQILQIQTDNPVYLAAIADIALERAHYLDAFTRYTDLLTITPDNGLIWEKRSDVIFALLTIPTAGADASATLKKTDLYTEGMKGYENAIRLRPDRDSIIKTKMEKRSEEYVPRTINDLEDRYREFRYLQPREKPLSS